MKRLISLVGFTLCLGACAQSPDAVKVTHYDDRDVQGSLGRHTVYAQETIWGIAQTYNVSMRDVIEANSLSAPFMVPAGTRLLIPAPHEYTAQRGDTLLRVSRMFGTTTTELAQLNKLRAPYKISAGKVLKLPGHGESAEPLFSQHNAQNAVVAVTPVYRETLSPSSPSFAPSPARPVAPPQTAKQAALSPSVHSGQGVMGDLVFVRPVSGNVISKFGPTQDGLHNDGINIKAPKGTGVKAAERGQVVYAGDQIEGYGHLILIKHAKGYITAYAHLDKILVKKGEQVSRGQTVGTVGSSGHVSSPQLHFEIRKDRDVLDPKGFIGKRV